MAYIERTDSEIRQALIRTLRRHPDQDKPIIGCFCHMLTPKQMADALEKIDNGEQLEEPIAHSARAVDTPEDFREVARAENRDPVAMLDETDYKRKKTWTQKLRDLLDQIIPELD